MRTSDDHRFRATVIRQIAERVENPVTDAWERPLPRDPPATEAEDPAIHIAVGDTGFQVTFGDSLASTTVDGQYITHHFWLTFSLEAPPITTARELQSLTKLIVHVDERAARLVRTHCPAYAYERQFLGGVDPSCDRGPFYVGTLTVGNEEQEPVPGVDRLWSADALTDELLRVCRILMPMLEETTKEWRQGLLE